MLVMYHDSYLRPAEPTTDSNGIVRYPLWTVITFVRKCKIMSGMYLCSNRSGAVGLKVVSVTNDWGSVKELKSNVMTVNVCDILDVHGYPMEYTSMLKRMLEADLAIGVYNFVRHAV